MLGRFPPTQPCALSLPMYRRHVSRAPGLLSSQHCKAIVALAAPQGADVVFLSWPCLRHASLAPVAPLTIRMPPAGMVVSRGDGGGDGDGGGVGRGGVDGGGTSGTENVWICFVRLAAIDSFWPIPFQWTPCQPSSKSSSMVSWQLELGDSQMLPSNGAPPESSLPPSHSSFQRISNAKGPSSTVTTKCSKGGGDGGGGADGGGGMCGGMGGGVVGGG
mmetsp:Transcript_17067/g.39061  ORF Transcript_17067/g.39061 Transcript_17067/m.39061 type:complete len:218 (-) Transcript_17067:132-785(-)